MHEATIRPISRYGKRGRPGAGAQPDQVVYQIDGAWASRVATRQALVDQHSCCILATHELDTTHLPPHEVLDGYKGQVQSERGLEMWVFYTLLSLDVASGLFLVGERIP